MTLESDQWNLERCERLRASMSDTEIEALRARSLVDRASLRLEEVGVLFLVTREQIRAIEAKAKDK